MWLNVVDGILSFQCTLLFFFVFFTMRNNACDNRKRYTRLRYKMCDALTDCLVMLGYSECPTARRNKSGYRETKVDTVVLLMLG